MVLSVSTQTRPVPVKSYGRVPEVIPLPNLIQSQRDSFRWFQQEGLRELFDEISPIVDFTGGKYELHFVKYDFREPKNSEMECRRRDLTFAAPLYITVELRRKDTNEIIAKEVFLGDIPLMTERGTFIINGAERVVVNQLIRSPGAYFTREKDVTTGRDLCYAKLIPNRGAWLEFETSNRDVLSVKVDRKRKIPITTFLRALGLGSDEDLLNLFTGVDTSPDHRYIQTTLEREPGVKTEQEALLDFYRRLRPGEPPNLENAQALMKALFFNFRRYDLGKVGRYKINTRLERAFTAEQAHKLRETTLKQALASGDLAESARKPVRDLMTIAFQELEAQAASSLLTREAAEGYATKAREEITRLVSSGKSVNAQAQNAFREFCKVLGGEAHRSVRVLHREDLVELVRRVIRLNNGDEESDDIDHLGNRRVRGVGELIQNQLRIGLLRMERVVKERMTLIDPQNAEPNALINIRPVVAAIKEFFGGSQLSQFMDQTNPLAELTHKRRLSALGPGGLSRERAGFDVRDVHHSHYGRICPIETPEGPNIGLLGSLASYARINQYGFIETPYRKVFKEMPSDSTELEGRTLAADVKDGKGKVVASAGDNVTAALAKTIASLKRGPVAIKPFASNHVVYLSADKEEKSVIAQANTPLEPNGEFSLSKLEVRQGQEFTQVTPEAVDLMDISPKQIVSVSTALIPFLEHDDANRALMGSNMQRQAVPLINSESPLVGTGMERRVALDSSQVLLSEVEGEVVHASGDRVVVRDQQGKDHVHTPIKFMRSNQGTCINQKVIVARGDYVRSGDPLADSFSTQRGDLALGQNVLCAFMSWEGYNYEDAIIISERVVREDKFTSIHIEKHECESRDTKLGPEEITRDIPNVGEESLKDLDEEGIIRIGAEVAPGDILVGKITPKGETELTPEEKLLRAIFGEKAREVKDTSLRVPHGERGKVIDVKVFSHENHDELSPGVNKLVRILIAQTRKLTAGDKVAGRHGNKGVIARVMPEADMPFLADGTPVDIILNPIGVPSRMNLGQVLETHLGWAANQLGFKVVSPVFDGATPEEISDALARAWIVLQSRAHTPGTNGDGKGSVDLPKARAWTKEKGYDPEKTFADGHAGYATRAALEVWLKDIGQRVSSNMSLEDLHDKALQLHRQSNVAPPVFGKMRLHDGRTGQAFDQPVTVGFVYIMKLIHLVEDKVHARSTGPYSLITQQPLGGKAQFGGQRFGEMEVWALEAYSAAHNLREILTIKSDDVVGRVKTYESIVKGEDIYQPGVPESFHVLLKELQSLGLSVELLNEQEPAGVLPSGEEDAEVAGQEAEAVAGEQSGEKGGK